MVTRAYGDISWERMIRAVEKVGERLERASTALERAGILRPLNFLQPQIV